jgi:DNA-binding CsgD family transcriptional regulator
MPASISTRAVVALDAIERLTVDDLSGQSVIEEILHRITDVVGVDAFFGGATDPDTGLCLGAGTVYNMAKQVCQPFWDYEFLIPDFNKFSDLDPQHPVADLRRATGGKLSRSPRYRALNSLSDLEDEVRVVLPAGGRTWGVLQFNRFSGGQPFSDEDLDFIRAAAPAAGTAMRRALLEEPARTDPARGPGVIVLDAQGNVLSSTAEADGWLEELARDWNSEIFPTTTVNPQLLTLSLNTLSEPSARRVRLRTPSGTWLIAHASPLGDSDQVALVIEPAKASEIAPVVVEANGLTAREVDVTRLVARGLSTDEIAGELFLSRHTVRDHLKAVFEKVGVSSRGELTSKLFAEHYHAPLSEAFREASDRVADRAGADR